MPLKVRYMGTKREIAPTVARIIADGPSGPLLDLFSGVCAIGSEVAPSRQVWSNDAQVFSTSVAQAFFASQEMPPNFDDIADAVRPLYQKNNRTLVARFSELLNREQEAITDKNYEALAELEQAIPHAASDQNCESERAFLSASPTTFPYRLFCITYAGGYVGLRQAIHIDSIRYAIDILKCDGIISETGHQWLVLALCEALSKVSTTTGHFAQYLSVKPETTDRFALQRKRSVWQEWLKAIFDLSPLGTKTWRKKNKVFRGDAFQLLENLKGRKSKPSIIYADPPYTDDQYSRYYHVYETLILYDYPESAGKGRYRPDRFVSGYSLSSKVQASMANLISGCAELGSSLVLSYPGKGLLPDAPNAISKLIKQHYGRVPRVTRLDHEHSSMGASKGHQKYKVQELIFAAGW